MKIVDILSEDFVISDLRAKNRDEVLEELIGFIGEKKPEIDRGYALSSLINRERIGSTGIGFGVAIPHAKLPSLSTGVACFARSLTGVEFGARDGQPTHLFLTLLAPEDGGGGFHLNALARASRMFRDETFLERLRAVDGREALYEAIRAKDDQLAA